MMVGLSMEVVLFCSWWVVGVNHITSWFKYIWPLFLVGDTTKFKTLISLSVVYHVKYAFE